MTKFKIVDLAGNDVNTAGEIFDSFDDGWTWIVEFIEDEEMHDELYVVEVVK